MYGMGYLRYHPDAPDNTIRYHIITNMMYMYKSMYRAVVLYRNESLLDDPDKSLN